MDAMITDSFNCLTDCLILCLRNCLAMVRCLVASWAIAARAPRYLVALVTTTALFSHFGYWPLRSSPRLRRSLQLMALALASSYISGAAASLCPALSRSGISGIRLRPVRRSVVLALGSGLPGARVLRRSGASVFGRFGPHFLGCSNLWPFRSSAAPIFGRSGLRILRRSGTQRSGTWRFPAISRAALPAADGTWCQVWCSPVRCGPRLLQSSGAPVLSGAQPLQC